MFYVIIIVAIIICILLGLIILIQEPKGGGLTSGFAGSNNIMGVQRTGDFLEKGTWILTISLMVLVLFANVVVPQGASQSREAQEIQNQINKGSNAPAPVAPAATPLPGLGDTSKR